MTSSSYYTYGLGTAAAVLALSNVASAFAPIATTPVRYSPSIVGGGIAQQSKATFTLPPLSVLTEDQALHTAERLSGMSRGEIQHIFEDIDADGSGTIDIAELDLLAKYFPGKKRQNRTRCMSIAMLLYIIVIYYAHTSYYRT